MESAVASDMRSRREGVTMPVKLFKCGWCGRDCYPNELRYSKKLDSTSCQSCDADNDITLGEIEAKKREEAKKAAWQNGVGWVK